MKSCCQEAIKNNEEVCPTCGTNLKIILIRLSRLGKKDE